MNAILKMAGMALLSLFVVNASLAGETDSFLKNRHKKGTAVTLDGKWYCEFKKCKAYADKNGVPLIAVWSNGDSCKHCKNFENACRQSVFVNWMKTSGCVFYFTYPKDGGEGKIASDVFHWIRGSNVDYPFVRVYWYVKGKKKVDICTVGDTVDGNSSGNSGGTKARDYFKKVLKAYKYTPTPAVPKYTGGAFAVGDTETDRLEADIGGTTTRTTSVELPLARTNTVVNSVSTNTVVISYPGNVTPSTNTIYWAKGDSETNLTVTIPDSLTTPNEKIEIILLNAAGKAVATSHVTMVESPENSPKNPFWVGEKTADELNWGEWTMDLDVALSKVNAYNAGTGETTSGDGARLLSAASPKDRAYTLLLLEGTLWCPDCKNTEANLIMQPEFKQWAQDNKVACVALDLSCGKTGDDPTATAPTLLTDEAMYGASGASYLSRKMIDKDAAADILDRNWEIAQKLRLPSASKRYRPPVPSLFVLRNDGTVAGRIEYFGSKSPTDASNIDAHIERLNELLRQVDDPVEEANDIVGTTTESVGPRTNVVDRTLSFVDKADVYRLDPEKTAGKRLAFTLTGADDVQLQVKVVAGGQTLATATGLLTEDVTAGAAIQSTNCYVSVSYPTNETHFAVASAASTLCTYTLKTDFIVDPTELAEDNTITLEGGENEVTVALVSNQLYRITHLDTADANNLAALVSTNGPGSATDLYLALETGDKRLKLTDNNTEIQKWNPGTVGFSITSASVLESAQSYNLRLVRRGGASGRATARVEFNTEKSSKYYESLFGLPEGFGDEIVWEEGDTDEKSLKLTILENTFADGDQLLYFDADVAGDAAQGIKQFRLTLRDNDKKVPGKIAITATTPAMAKDMTTFARAGTDVKLELTRVDGTTGEQVVTLAASAGTLDGTTFSWSNRVSAAEEAKLTLPAEPGKVKVTMTPEKGSFVDGKRRVLTVDVLDPDVPGFVGDSEIIVYATRYIPITETCIALDDKATDDTTVKKFSGSLPDGVKWSFNKGEKKLVISGMPTKAGSFTAVFRASTGKKEGLIVAVTIDVTDPVTAGGGENGAEPLNASVAVTRTFADVPVFDTTMNRLAGVFTLTMPRTGRVSAKYRGVDAGIVTLASKSWSEIGVDGTLTAELTGKTADGTDCAMTVGAMTNGTLVVEFADPMAQANSFKVLLPGVTWSKKLPATDFKGYYTVSLPQKAALSGMPCAKGAGYATLKMNTAAAINAGKFAYAGVLPDGRAFSGSAVATPDAWQVAGTTSFWSRAVIPVVVLGSLNKLAGALQLTPGAADAKATNMVESGFCSGRCYYQTIRRSVAPATEADLFWRHTEKAAEACYEVPLDAFGTYYVSTDNLANCCKNTFSENPLKFFVQDEGDDHDSAAWPTNGAPVVTVSYTKKTKTNAIKAASNKRGLTLTFTPSTGLVSGTFTLNGEKMTYKGVVMPGWGSDECTACGYSEDKGGGVETQLRPFISGAAWFNDDVTYQDEKGRARTISVRYGCPFSIGAQSGK